jgi:hypothetical protein
VVYMALEKEQEYRCTTAIIRTYISHTRDSFR